jgi:hypothetical protein
MDITSKIKAILNLTGHKQIELMEPLQMKSRQSLGNKFSNNRWSAEDLVTVAEATGCELAFILPDGQKIVLKKEMAGQ